MNKIITFQISDDIFWGYQVKINMHTVHSVEQIISIIKHDIITYLKPKNLEILIEKIRDKNFYCISFEDILLCNSGDTVYLCNHPTDNYRIYNSYDYKSEDDQTIYETKQI